MPYNKTLILHILQLLYTVKKYILKMQVISERVPELSEFVSRPHFFNILVLIRRWYIAASIKWGGGVFLGNVLTNNMN